jgi:hypothetical protein
VLLLTIDEATSRNVQPLPPGDRAKRNHNYNSGQSPMHLRDVAALDVDVRAMSKGNGGPTENPSKLKGQLRRAQDEIRRLVAELHDRRTAWMNYIKLMQDLLGLPRSIQPLVFIGEMVIWECAAGSSPCKDPLGRPLKFVTHSADPQGNRRYGSLTCPWCEGKTRIVRKIEDDIRAARERIENANQAGGPDEGKD